jgi:CO/xanthine dehydrogenase Mo-binding subunit
MLHAVDSFIDELALAANTDPVEFRLRYLTNPRAIAVIKAAAEKAQWQPHVGPRKQVKGIAYAARTHEVWRDDLASVMRDHVAATTSSQPTTTRPRRPWLGRPPT